MIQLIMVDFNDLEQDEVVPKIINKKTTFRNKSSYNFKSKFDKFPKGLTNADYVWKYCV